MGGEIKDLDRRSRAVLASVIATYIRSAVPVSSRQLSRMGGFDLSPASLRNAMADLEELGFLTHPHVSAGRVPTDLGWRAYVQELMAREAPRREDRDRIEADLGSEKFDLDHFLHATSRVLSRLTGEVGIVASPDAARILLKSVHFTRVAERKVVVVQVSGADLVDSRLIETREDFPQAELDAASARLTAEYAGKTLLEIRRDLLAALEEEKVRFDAALARTLELGRHVFSEDRPGGEALWVEGTETIVEKPEFHRDVEALRRLFRALDEKARLINLLSACISGRDELAVLIGTDSSFTAQTESAVVVTAYRAGDRVLGALGVIGPRRMEYPRVVPLVEELGRYVTRRLTEVST